MQPAEDDLAAAVVRDPLDRDGVAGEPAQQRARRDVHQVAREVEREPTVAEGLCLPGAGVGDGDDQDAVGREQARGDVERVARCSEMLE